MRQVTHADIVAAARLLSGMPRRDWQSVMVAALERAHAADLFRKKYGRSHRRWGNGSLAAVFLGARPLPPERFLSDLGFLEAAAAAIHQVIEWKMRQNVN